MGSLEIFSSSEGGIKTSSEKMTLAQIVEAGELVKEMVKKNPKLLNNK
jgi:hypothetical protein